MTAQEARETARRYLAGHGVPDAGTDTWLLLSHVTGWDKPAYFLRQDSEIDPAVLLRFQEMIRRRADREPLQQILGYAWFYGYRFRVTEQVLTPRQDTEVLVETALRGLRSGMRVLDLCTGSGCILLTVLLEAEKRGLRIAGTGSDLSEEALAVAKRNRKELGVSAQLLQSDLFEAVSGNYDLILSNPPYIQDGVIETLEPEVRLHEPRMALSGGADGMDFYRRIVRDAPVHLNPGGQLIFEIGYDEGNAVKALMEAAHFSDCRIRKDLSGLDRVAEGRWIDV